MDGIFGDLFDFDRDGELDSFERAMECVAVPFNMADLSTNEYLIKKTRSDEYKGSVIW